MYDLFRYVLRLWVEPYEHDITEMLDGGRYDSGIWYDENYFVVFEFIL